MVIVLDININNVRVILAVVGEEIRDDLQRGQCLDLLRDLAFDHRGFLRLEYLFVDDEKMKMWTRKVFVYRFVSTICKLNGRKVMMEILERMKKKVDVITRMNGIFG